MMVDMDLEGILEGLTLDEKTDENSRSLGVEDEARWWGFEVAT